LAIIYYWNRFPPNLTGWIRPEPWFTVGLPNWKWRWLIFCSCSTFYRFPPNPAFLNLFLPQHPFW